MNGFCKSHESFSVLETAIETMLGVALLFGVWQRIVAWCSAGLLLSFALTMSVALGVVAPLSYSVFTAFGGAFLLGAIAAPASKGLSAADSTSRKEKLRHDPSVAVRTDI